MIEISLLKVLAPHRLLVEFSDGSQGEFDARSMVAEAGPLIAPLKAADYFARVFLEAGAPTWPNGFDLSPQWLHSVMAEQGVLKRPKSAA